jgi:hypothetical protein
MTVGCGHLIIPWGWLKKHAGDSVNKVHVSLVLRYHKGMLFDYLWAVRRGFFLFPISEFRECL